LTSTNARWIPGAVGELIVRTDRPWAMNHGYFRDPAATARACRNGWCHTGGACRADGEGNYFFVDRIKRERIAATTPGKE